MRIKLEKGITFNGEHSYDEHRMILTNRTIGLPNKNKILETVPFSNIEYDFSEIFGAQTYEQRELTYEFILFNHRKVPDLERFRISCINWLMTVNKQAVLKDDEIENYYFLGEVRTAPECTFNIKTDVYEVSVTFTCYPFKIGELAEGNDLWDPFNFDTDVFQDTVFTIAGSKSIKLINNGVVPVCPTVVCTSGMSVALDGTTYTFSTGTTQANEFMLKVGGNFMTISGTGTIEFIFYKELL